MEACNTINIVDTANPQAALTALILFTEDQPNKDDESKEPPKKRSRLLGNVDINSAEFKKLLKVKSAHKGALAEVSMQKVFSEVHY